MSSSTLPARIAEVVAKADSNMEIAHHVAEMRSDEIFEVVHGYLSGQKLLLALKELIQSMDAMGRMPENERFHAACDVAYRTIEEAETLPDLN